MESPQFAAAVSSSAGVGHPDVCAPRRAASISSTSRSITRKQTIMNVETGTESVQGAAPLRRIVPAGSGRGRARVAAGHPFRVVDDAANLLQRGPIDEDDIAAPSAAARPKRPGATAAPPVTQAYHHPYIAPGTSMNSRIVGARSRCVTSSRRTDEHALAIEVDAITLSMPGVCATPPRRRTACETCHGRGTTGERGFMLARWPGQHR